MSRLGRYLGILVFAVVFWNTIVVKPLRLFAVFLHELGHAFMAVVFGYGISAFKINLNESGYTIVRTKGLFSDMMVASGGYLGSVVFAVLILYFGRTFLKDYILGALAILFIAISIKFSGVSFTLMFSSFFVIFVLLLYMIRSEALNEWVIDIIGVSCVAYAIYDTFVDTVLLQINNNFNIIKGWGKNQALTDAVRMQQLTNIPAIFWGLLWFSLSIFVVIVLIKKTGYTKARKKSKG